MVQGGSGLCFAPAAHWDRSCGRMVRGSLGVGCAWLEDTWRERDRHVKACVPCSRKGKLSLCPKRGLKYKKERTEPQICRALCWGCAALCCDCLCPLPRPPELFLGSSLGLPSEGRCIANLLAPSGSRKRSSTAQRAVVRNAPLASGTAAFPGCYLFSLTQVVVSAVSSGLFKMRLINARLASPGGTSEISAADGTEMHTVRLIWRRCSFVETQRDHKHRAVPS